MKFVNATFQSFLVLATLSVAPAFAGGRECLAASTTKKTVTIEARVDESVRVAVEMARSRQPIGPALEDVVTKVDEEALSYVGAPGECLIQKRLAGELADLRARADRYLVHAFEVEALQREIVLGRLERAIIQLKEAWSQGRIADDVLEMAIATLQADAFLWFEQHSIVSVRERLQNALFAAQQAANDQVALMKKTQAFFEIVYEARFESAIFVLTERIKAGKATKADYQRLEDLNTAFAILQKKHVPYDCGS